jgi:hypothetical protein
MRPIHPSTVNGVSDSSVGKVQLVCSEAYGIPVIVGTVGGGFRWYQEDSGDEVTDEILAWAATEEAKNPPPGKPLDHAPLAGQLPG